MKTIRYSQPHFYHFSAEAIALARYAAEKMRTPKRILDCFAGCGVVGIEFAMRLGHDLTVDGLEKQIEFKTYWRKNMLQAKLSGHFIHGHFDEIHLAGKYDLILANPPFYLEGRGRLPSDANKQQCHFMLESEWIAWKNFLRQYDCPHFFLASKQQAFIQQDDQLFEHEALGKRIAIFSLR